MSSSVFASVRLREVHEVCELRVKKLEYHIKFNQNVFLTWHSSSAPQQALQKLLLHILRAMLHSCVRGLLLQMSALSA